MTTFAQEIIEFVGSEPILAIAVGPERSGGGWWKNSKPDHQLGSAPVSWEQAFPVLNYEYDAGYGGQDCHDIWVWTATRIISVHEYDGSTCLISVARNPENFSDGL